MPVQWANRFTVILKTQTDALAEVFHEKNGNVKTGRRLPNARRQAAIEAPRKPLTFIATGISREAPLYKLVSSVAEHFPTAEIIIAWQGTASSEMQAFFAKYSQATLHEIDQDAGLSKARNFLVKQVKTDNFCLCDDDFIFRSADGIDLGAALLDAEPEIGIVGGQLTNFNYDVKGNLTGTADITYASRMTFDEKAGALQNISIDLLKEPVYTIGTQTYQLCDIILNFAIMRKSLFKDGRNAWDESMKITGEHVDFYLQNLTNPMYKIAYLPLMHCEHHRVQTVEYQSLRSRRDGLYSLYAKWDIKIESRLPGFVRTISPEDINLTKLQEPDATPKKPAIVTAKRKPDGKPINAILMPFNRCGASLLFKSFNSDKIAKASNLFKGNKVRTGPLDEKYLKKYLGGKTQTTALVTNIYAGNPKFEQMMAFFLQQNTKFIILDRQDVVSVAASILAKRNNVSPDEPANVDPSECADLAREYDEQRVKFMALMRSHQIDAPKFDYTEITSDFKFVAAFANKYFNLPGSFTDQKPPTDMNGATHFKTGMQFLPHITSPHSKLSISRFRLLFIKKSLSCA